MLARCLQECREKAGMSRYALEKACGVSRDMIGDVESGRSVPTFFLLVRLLFGMGLSLEQFLPLMTAAQASDISD